MAAPVGCRALLAPAGDQPSWAAGTALDLRGANKNCGPRWRNLAKIRYAFDPPFVTPEECLVGLVLLVRPDVERDGIDPDASDVPLLDQKVASVLCEAGEVERVRLIGTQIGLGVAGLYVPTGIHEHGTPSGQASMLLLPRCDVLDCHRTVRVFLGALADVDDRSWDDQAAQGKLLQGLGPGDEVAGGVDVRAVVLD